MSAQEYRARADALVEAAEGCTDKEIMLAMEATARDWRRLADVADWQDAVQLALARSERR
jgi:hypothetical protein